MWLISIEKVSVVPVFLPIWCILMKLWAFQYDDFCISLGALMSPRVSDRLHSWLCHSGQCAEQNEAFPELLWQKMKKRSSELTWSQKQYSCRLISADFLWKSHALKYQLQNAQLWSDLPQKHLFWTTSQLDTPLACYCVVWISLYIWICCLNYQFLMVKCRFLMVLYWFLMVQYMCLMVPVGSQ